MFLVDTADTLVSTPHVVGTVKHAQLLAVLSAAPYELIERVRNGGTTFDNFWTQQLYQFNNVSTSSKEVLDRLKNSTWAKCFPVDRSVTVLDTEMEVVEESVSVSSESVDI